ncbi:hypothetical protein ASPVEDRAFT_35142 [Aspergillus versicolor CBS 583.65]|uniref:WSC domain-containing protein n=1 Tax=Aspergillus versicolor CBS 583.65 TaxID=1036611 RepID=A0A1L9P2Q8_ASPVE|nr:uncharacterized protein ASPVEDRAFT_35142 [Aspergillus versicolor CBS 583.65]OJI95830.1 hypothetical protein ASPVEDRAFT_35142 [Aspergillus versicolor CBS 583.65]
MKLTSAFAVLPFAVAASKSEQANYIGCFTSSGSLANQGSYTFESVGHCLNTCEAGDFKYAAVQKNDCFCGNAVPEQTDLTADDQCGSPCPGFAGDNCGGRAAWSVYFGRNGSKPDWLSSSSVAVTSTSTVGATSSESSTSSTSSASTSTSQHAIPSSGSPTSSASVSKDPSASASTSSIDPTNTPNSASRRFKFGF